MLKHFSWTKQMSLYFFHIFSKFWRTSIDFVNFSAMSGRTPKVAERNPSELFSSSFKAGSTASFYLSHKEEWSDGFLIVSNQNSFP